MRYIPNQEILVQRFATQRNFTLPRLFDGGFQGVVYDPLNIATLFQDSAGTTPVTAPGDPVARVLDLSGNGHHATQTTDSSRMTYGVVPKGGRRNLLTNSALSGATSGTPGTVPTGWTFTSSGGSQVVNGDEITINVNNNRHYYQRSVAFEANATYTYSALVTVLSGNPQLINCIAIQSLLSGASFTARLNGAVVSDSTNLATGLSLVELVITIGSTAGSMLMRFGAGTSSNRTFEAIFSRPQIEIGSTRTNYQRVGTTAFDITETGVQSCPYLQPDGIDDWLVTPSIDFSGTDAVTVFGAVRCLSDANIGTLLELSTNSSTTNGTFALLDRGNANPSVSWRSRGNVENVIDITRGAAPVSSVYAAQGRISTDFSTLRRNGVEIGSSTADQGSGNFANAPLYIGRRNGTTNAFNGQIFGLAVVGKLASAEEIRLAKREMVRRSAMVTLA